MDYQNVIEQARSCIGPYCRACPVCDGRACKNTMPGPGAKGMGMWRSEISRSGRKSGSTWIPSVRNSP